MSLVEMVIGFDAREMLVDSKLFWSTDRRETFLLRTSVQKPLSTDPLVWPDVLHVDRILARSFPIEGMGDLSASLAELDSVLSDADVSGRAMWHVALTRIGDSLTKHELRGWPLACRLDEIRS